jgi:hypothetical protein
MREIFYGDPLPPSGIRTRSLDLLFQWHLATDIQSYFLFKLLLSHLHDLKPVAECIDADNQRFNLKKNTLKKCSEVVVMMWRLVAMSK